MADILTEAGEQGQQTGGAGGATGVADPSGSGDNSGAGGSSSNTGGGDTHGDLPGFHKQFSKEYQGHADLQDLRTPDSFAEAVINSKKALSGSVRMPGEGATDEDRAQFDDRVAKYYGKPGEQSGYTFEGVELPEGYTPTEADQNAFRQLAFNSNLTVQQANRLYAASVKQVVDVEAHIQQRRYQTKKAGDVQLKMEWGETYDKNKELANRAVGHYLTKYPNLAKVWQAVGITDEPDMRRLFSDIGSDISEKLSPRSSAAPAGAPQGDKRFSKLDEYVSGRINQE